MDRNKVKMVCRLENERKAISDLLGKLNCRGSRKITIKIAADDQNDIVVFPESGVDKLELALRGLLSRIENDIKNL